MADKWTQAQSIATVVIAVATVSAAMFGVFQILPELRQTSLQQQEALTQQQEALTNVTESIVKQLEERPVVILRDQSPLVELDQKVYTWTDIVYITVISPSHNVDSTILDRVGLDPFPITISTREFTLENYMLAETGFNTGIFTGEVILSGFAHDVDGDGISDTDPRTHGTGPTNGFLQTSRDDTLTVAFEFSEGKTVVGSAITRWNVGEIQWTEPLYSIGDTATIRIIDPDANLHAQHVDKIHAKVWSIADPDGIDIVVRETNQATGIFEGEVILTLDESRENKLKVANGGMISASYSDRTLPRPAPINEILTIQALALVE